MLRIWQCSHRKSFLGPAKALLSALGQLVFPSYCLLCGEPFPSRPPILLCPKCRGDVKFIHGPLCSVCGKPFAAEDQPEHLCQICLTQPRHFDKARAITFYEGPMLEAIKQFKFGKKIIFVQTLGRLKNGDWPLGLDSFDLFIPVPLHVKRLRERGFNQALLLLKEWAGPQRKRVDFISLIRHRWTEPQTNLSHHERQRNIKGAFSVKYPEKIRGQNILLGDDVFTTGATVNECARALRKAGARNVTVLTLARAVWH